MPKKRNTSTDLANQAITDLSQIHGTDAQRVATAQVHATLAVAAAIQEHTLALRGFH